MFCASDERIVLGSKENLDENMANFSLKVIETEFYILSTENFWLRNEKTDISFIHISEKAVWLLLYCWSREHTYMDVTKRYESLVSLRGNTFRANFFLLRSVTIQIIISSYHQTHHLILLTTWSSFNISMEYTHPTWFSSTVAFLLSNFSEY